MTENPFNAGDEQQVKTRKRKVDIERDLELAAVKEVMGTALGRAFMWRLLGITGIHRTTFSTNALTMAFNEGQRNIGLTLEAEILEACPSLYLTMQAEAAGPNKENASA